MLEGIRVNHFEEDSFVSRQPLTEDMITFAVVHGLRRNPFTRHQPATLREIGSGYRVIGIGGEPNLRIHGLPEKREWRFGINSQRGCARDAFPRSSVRPCSK